MSKLDTGDNINADKLRKLLSCMIENQLLELSDNVYKIKWTDTIENVFPEISETETFVINETQITPEKTRDNEVTKEQMVNSIERSTISNKDVEPLPYDIDQPVDSEKQ